MRNKAKIKSMEINEITKIFSRKLYNINNSFEIFMENGRSYFFNLFSEDKQSEIIHKLLKINSKISAILNPVKEFRNSNFLEKWQKREISTFEYLMNLNYYSGRSFNLIFKYPIFPWILSNYSSNELDFADSKNFRYFQYPIGCMTPKTQNACREKYKDFDDVFVAKFHHGTYYSTYGHILYYLIRMLPFTEMAKELQGGKIDLADRLFSDIGGTWNVCLNSLGDVKELIPEFFFLPHFLMNLYIKKILK